MKVLPFVVPRTDNEQIVVQRDRLKNIYSILHQHPEVQLTVVREGSGTVVIGGYIGEYQAGDVFIIGSGLPHVFRQDDANQILGSSWSEIIYVFLDEGLSNLDFLAYPEVREMFDKSRRGIRLEGPTKERIGAAIIDLVQLSGLDKFISVLNMINTIVKSAEVSYLNFENINYRMDDGEGKRLNAVIQYTFDHYQEKITLEDISKVANMASSSFCRFFKQRTRKTYMDFLNEIRIQKASKLLVNKDHSIVEISYQSGFKNLSNFNRKFKAVTGYTPLQYHKALKGE